LALSLIYKNKKINYKNKLTLKFLAITLIFLIVYISSITKSKKTNFLSSGNPSSHIKLDVLPILVLALDFSSSLSILFFFFDPFNAPYYNIKTSFKKYNQTMSHLSTISLIFSTTFRGNFAIFISLCIFDLKALSKVSEG